MSRPPSALLCVVSAPGRPTARQAGTRNVAVRTSTGWARLVLLVGKTWFEDAVQR